MLHDLYHLVHRHQQLRTLQSHLATQPLDQKVVPQFEGFRPSNSGFSVETWLFLKTQVPNCRARICDVEQVENSSMCQQCNLSRPTISFFWGEFFLEPIMQSEQSKKFPIILTWPIIYKSFKRSSLCSGFNFGLIFFLVLV